MTRPSPPRPTTAQSDTDTRPADVSNDGPVTCSVCGGVWLTREQAWSSPGISGCHKITGSHNLISVPADTRPEARAGEATMCACGHSYREHGEHGCMNVAGLLSVCPCTIPRETVLLSEVARLTERNVWLERANGERIETVKELRARLTADRAAATREPVADELVERLIMTEAALRQAVVGDDVNGAIADWFRPAFLRDAADEIQRAIDRLRHRSPQVAALTETLKIREEQLWADRSARDEAQELARQRALEVAALTEERGQPLDGTATMQAFGRFYDAALEFARHPSGNLAAVGKFADAKAEFVAQLEGNLRIAASLSAALEAARRARNEIRATTEPAALLLAMHRRQRAWLKEHPEEAKNG